MEVEVDPESRQIVKLTVRAADMPPESLAEDVELAIVYGKQKIKETEFLLPVRSESRDTIFGQIVKAEPQFNSRTTRSSRRTPISSSTGAVSATTSAPVGRAPT